METVGALTPDQRAVVSWHFAVRTAAIEGHPADPTVFVVGHPQPGGHPAPLADLHLHPPALTGQQQRSLNELPLHAQQPALACALKLTGNFRWWLFYLVTVN